jgi:hypothetical protein
MISAAPATAQHVSTAIAVVAPAPEKYAVDRSSVPLAPCGNSWPRVPQPRGSISGALASPDSGLPSSIATAELVPPVELFQQTLKC